MGVGAKNSSGKSYASACTSCGSASVTGPHSAGSVSVLGVADGAEWSQIPVGGGPGGVVVDLLVLGDLDDHVGQVDALEQRLDRR